MITTYQRDYTWPTYLSKPSDSGHAEDFELELARKENQDKDICERERKRVEKYGSISNNKKAIDCGIQFVPVPDYLVKLFTSFPELYIYYKEVGEEQLMKKIEEHLYKSLYQVDYGKDGFMPKDNYDILLEVAEAIKAKREKVCTANVHGDEAKRVNNNCTAGVTEECICGIDQPELPKDKPISITKIRKIKTRKDKKAEEAADQESFEGTDNGPGKPPEGFLNNSEYKETIDKLGKDIIKYKIHAKSAHKAKK